MVSKEKIKQVFNAIKENGLDAFDDESLAKLLSILNKEELDEFVSMVYRELDGVDATVRVMNILPLVELIVNRDLYRIRTSELYRKYIESLNSSEYRDFFKTLKIEELADLKKYVSYTINPNDEANVTGSKKIINMITKEIKSKESARKPKFGDNA